MNISITADGDQMDDLDRYFVKYCFDHFSDLDEFEEAFKRVLHQYKIIKTMDRNELIKLLRLSYNDFMKGPHPKPFYFEDYLAWMHPLAKKRLDLGI